MSALTRLAELFFVPKCVFCGRVLDSGGLCDECRERLPWLSGTFRGVEFASKCVAPLRYEGLVRESLLRFKFSGKESYARQYGLFIAEAAEREVPGEYDIVTWVPVSGRRLRKRGFDQARLIAEETAKALGAECEALLEKRRDTPAQSRLDTPEERRANVSGAYAARKPEKTRGRRVLLIDDIITTGATASECARVLLMAGSEDVICAALASARKQR